MLPTPLVSVWMGFSSCSDAHVICFTKIGFFVVGVCSNGLKECIWGSYSGIKVTHQSNEIVKWNVTNAVSEVVIQSVLVSRGGLFCWCICANNSYFRITINSNEYIRLLIFLICKMFFVISSVIRRPISSWDLSVAVLYMKWYPLKIIDVVSSFVRHRCSCIATTSMLNVLHSVISWWSLPGLNSVRTL